MAKLVQDGDVFTPDHLFVSGSIPVLTQGINLVAGTNAKRGAIIIADASTGKGEVADKAKVDHKLVGVLTDDVNAESDTIATVYITGHFNRDALSCVSSTTYKDYEEEMKKLGMYLDTVKGEN